MKTNSSGHAPSIVPVERLSGIGSQLEARVRDVLWRWELAALGALIVFANLPLLSGHASSAGAFVPSAVWAGEWWRLLTHPWVHVSWYHLLLDATAFFMGYVELRERRFIERLALLGAATAGSLMAALAAAPAVADHGLCGLSAIAHGLAAVVGLEMFSRRGDRLLRGVGLACFLGVVGKSIVEAATGHVVFASWHLGQLGTPIAVCHAGGILGALVVWFIGHLLPLPSRSRCAERKSTGACPEGADAGTDRSLRFNPESSLPSLCRCRSSLHASGARPVVDGPARCASATRRSRGWPACRA